MISFLTDDSGDIIVTKNDIQLVEDENEVVEQMKFVLGTNNGEWHFNEDYGIHFKNILMKNPIEELISDEIRGGIAQCTTEVNVKNIDIEIDTKERHLMVDIKAELPNSAVIERVVTYDVR